MKESLKNGFALEANFDGIIGPTHNYSGLSFGNVASTRNQDNASNPRQAALQGLAKMKALFDLGLTQGVLPPQERPDIFTLRRLGFRGTDAKILADAMRVDPKLVYAISSASSMWTANAATVSPSTDTRDGKVHFTTANLSSKFHRSIEPIVTARALKAIFKDPTHFAHHHPLPPVANFGDEGAANHTRFCSSYGEVGLEFFVYGKNTLSSEAVEPQKYPARQTLAASLAVSRLNRLLPQRVVFGQQAPRAIDAGVFHNDVAAVGNKNVFFYHQAAYLESARVVSELQSKFKKITGAPLLLVNVKSNQISLEKSIKTYLFNSQLVSVQSPSGKDEMILIAPSECEEDKSVRRYLLRLTEESSHPIRQVRFFNLRESMRNGGGPACLRLRVVLKHPEIQACNPKAFMTENLYKQLVDWVNRHYRDRLSPFELADPALLNESRKALDELTQLLDLGSIYRFQRSSRS
jgi:succinylarginine dihydrolase